MKRSATVAHIKSLSSCNDVGGDDALYANVASSDSQLFGFHTGLSQMTHSAESEDFDDFDTLNDTFDENLEDTFDDMLETNIDENDQSLGITLNFGHASMDLLNTGFIPESKNDPTDSLKNNMHHSSHFQFADSFYFQHSGLNSNSISGSHIRKALSAHAGMEKRYNPVNDSSSSGEMSSTVGGMKRKVFGTITVSNGETSDTEDLFSTLDSTCSNLSGEDDGEDILHFEGVEYTTYDEGSDEHHRKVLKQMYKADKRYMENVYTFGLPDTDFYEFFHSLGNSPDYPEMLKKSIEKYNVNRMEAAYLFYRCLTSESMDDRYRMIALTWILIIFSSTRSQSSKFSFLSSSAKDKLFQEMDTKKRSRSCAGVKSRSENSISNPMIITPEMEEEIASHVLKAAERFHLLAFQVGELYRVGRGVKKDLAKAFEWYKRSYTMQHQQHRTSCLLLGLSYMNGFGCERNLHLAESYFENAQRMKDLRASKFLQRCRRLIKFEAKAAKDLMEDGLES